MDIDVSNTKEPDLVRWLLSRIATLEAEVQEYRHQILYERGLLSRQSLVSRQARRSILQDSRPAPTAQTTRTSVW